MNFEAWRASICRNFAWHVSAKVSLTGSTSSPLLYSAKAKPTSQVRVRVGVTVRVRVRGSGRGSSKVRVRVRFVV